MHIFVGLPRNMDVYGFDHDAAVAGQIHEPIAPFLQQCAGLLGEIRRNEDAFAGLRMARHLLYEGFHKSPFAAAFDLDIKFLLDAAQIVQLKSIIIKSI